ncbi:Alkbh6 protein [Drechmeria coniospora]|uniref:Alkbh6 protein n=1 Tax=Drechmeria coniospora TaxID=98403 RepID=A0A151GSL8_DRECN|nr:Alkbh6 protein [Drechmeria coniospora]KYK60109.1 Alkbh6 protein [Drechmeria coniospora]
MLDIHGPGPTATTPSTSLHRNPPAFVTTTTYRTSPAQRPGLLEQPTADSPHPSVAAGSVMASSLPPSLEQARIQGLPSTAYYIPNFISEEEEDSILAKDGAAYWPVVCTVSLGASLCLNLHRTRDDGALDPTPAWRILQEPRSLLITTECLYTDYLHGIADIDEDVNLSAEGGVVNWPLLRDPDAHADGRNVRKLRTSLTFRDVVKVSTMGTKLPMLAR